MNASEALIWAQSQLETKGVDSARLDALVLLEDATNIDRAKLLAEKDQIIRSGPLKQFKLQVKQRSKRIPLSFIRGKTEFYGREFKISRSVLEPRPESETIIEELGLLINREPKLSSVIDVGTGSGALAITAKLEFPSLKVFAVDISSRCLSVAKFNSRLYRINIGFFRGDLIKPLPLSAWSNKAVIIANLPYVPESWQINPEAMREPRIAIFGGTDGLDIYRKLFKQLSGLSLKPEYVLTESMPPQHPELVDIAARHRYQLTKTNDFIQVYKRLQ